MALVHRLMLDQVDGNITQVGCAIFVDGERRSEAWEQVGPFDEVRPAQDRAIQVAEDLYLRQVPGQQRWC